MDSYLEFVLERLSVAGKVTAKAMFGGHGIYLGDVIFGLVVDGVLYTQAKLNFGLSAPNDVHF